MKIFLQQGNNTAFNNKKESTKHTALRMCSNQCRSDIVGITQNIKIYLTQLKKRGILALI